MSPSRIRSLVAAAAIVVAAGSLLQGQPTPGARPLSAAPALQPAPAGCAITATKLAAPPVVRLGEEVTVTLHTRLDCPQPAPPLHLVLALDGSGSMAGTPSSAMKTAAGQLVRDLDLPGHPDWLVGVVGFNITARTLCRLTNVQSQVIACVNRVGAAGGTRVDAALTEAQRALAPGRSVSAARQAIVVVTDGDNNTGCSAILQVARQVRGQGVLLAVACLGRNCDRACLEQTASTPDLYFGAAVPADLTAALGAVHDVLIAPAAAYIEVVDEPGADMSLLRGSALPPALAETNSSVRWFVPWPPARGVTMTLRLRPDRVGYWPANSSARGSARSLDGQPHGWTYPVPYVLVLDPSVPPSVTVTVPPTPVPSVPPLPPPASATPPYPVPLSVCDEIRRSVPPAAIGAALADPSSVAGFGRPCRAELPPGPGNGLRASLSLQSAAKPYHPLYNGLVWKCGCP